METTFKRVHTGKDWLISGITIAAGIGLYFLNTGLGIFVGICGILMLLFYKSGYLANGTGPVLKKKAMDVPRSCRQSIVDFLDGQDVEPQIDDRAIGGVIRIETYYNKAAGIAYTQLFDFSNYNYQPATDVVKLVGPRADKLISKLK
ncbi:MAG: hypothetical protein IJR25_02045 [Bacteroidales bacterium]|nr:hypothetical protein [Bacteroidales bacterium]